MCGGGWEFNKERPQDFRTARTVSYRQPAQHGRDHPDVLGRGSGSAQHVVVAAPTYRSAGVLPGYKGAMELANQTRQGAFIMVGRNNKRFRDE